MSGWRWLVAGVFVAALAACDESITGPSVPLDKTFTMAPGDVVSLEDTSARVQFHGVEGDSRCPADANCIQGGDAVVRVSVTVEGTRRDDELHTGSMAPVRHDGLTLALVELAPYPFSSRTSAPGDYRATLRATR
jgi:hypothetical protein